MISKIIFRAKNKDIIANLNEAANRITEQEEIINQLREKIEGEKEILMEEIKEDYKKLEEIKESYRKYFSLAPFHLTKEELIDLNHFRNKHQSAKEERDEEDFRYCSYVNDYQSQITFHYIPSIYSHKVIVECPYCHTKRELGTGTDVLEEMENKDDK